MGENSYRDSSGRPYVVRDGRSVWLPEPIYLHDRRPYTFRAGQSVWIDHDMQDAGAPDAPALFSVSFDQSEEDVVAMLSDLRIAGPLRRQRMRRIVVLSVSLGANGLLFFWSLFDGEASVSAFLLGAALVTGALITASLVGLVTGGRRARDHIRIDPLYRASVLGTQTVLATDRLIRNGGVLQQTSTSWELVSEVVHGRHSVILFSGDRYVLGVPLHAFSTPEAVADFEALVRLQSGSCLTSASS